MAASALIKQAAVVRLDVYGENARCEGSTLAPGAPPPTQSETVTAGKTLTLDVLAGHHVLLLSAFRDAAATELLGSACTTTDVVAGQPACFDLKLAAAPDGAVPNLPSDMAVTVDDLAGNASLGDGHFVACSAAPDNCPAGQFCSSDGNCREGCKVDRDCAGTPTTPRCLVAAHECVECLGNVDCGPGNLCTPSNTCTVGCDPHAPSCPGQQMCCTDACIDTSSDVNNCGNCDSKCKLDNATPTCSGSQCAIKQCKNGFSDCNGKASDGCECTDLGDANHGCCPPNPSNPSGCEFRHDDGFGDSFIDCYPRGTYSDKLAIDAANAAIPGGTIAPLGNCSPGGQLIKCIEKPGECICFTYSDTAGGSYTGLAHRTTSAIDMGARCTCPPSLDPKNPDHAWD
jgi:hypothetical protein